MKEVKAIIFDCFGVLVESSLEPFYHKYFNGDVEKETKARVLERESSSGQMSYQAFAAEMAKLAGITVEETRRMLDDNPANIALLEYIRDELRPHYKIGFLSNASDNWLDELFTPDQQQLFDDVVLSFQHSLAKPDAAIFHLAAKRLGVAPATCVFVDDIARYCDGATSVGMQAIQYLSLPQLRDALANVL